MDRASNCHDYAIHGWGMLPALLTLHLLENHPGSRVLLQCGDAVVGGDQIEPVVVSRLSSAARALAERCCVASWPSYFVIRDGTAARHDDAIWLLDPMQVWLEIAEHESRCMLRTGCSEVSPVKSADRLIDLTPLTLPQAESEIRGNDLVRQLGLPILEDYDLAPPGWRALQLLPLGDERVMVRKLPLHATLVAAAASFESLFNALVDE